MEKRAFGISIHDQHTQPVHYLTNAFHGVVQREIIRDLQLRLHHRAAGFGELMEETHRLPRPGRQLAHFVILERFTIHDEIHPTGGDGFGACIFHRYLH